MLCNPREESLGVIGDTLGTQWRFMVREASHSGGTGGQGPGKRRTLRKAVKPFDPSRIEANEQMVAPRSKMNLTKQAQYNWEETKPARFPMHTNHLLTGTIASTFGT